MPPSLAGRSAFIRYSAAVVAVGLAFAVRAAINHLVGAIYPYGTFFVAALLCAWWMGLGPGLVSLALGAIVVRLVAIDPGSRYLFTGGEAVGSILYVGSGICLIALLHSLRIVHSHLETRIEQLTKARTEAVALTSLLHLAQDAILSHGMTGAIEFWNHGAERMYGWSATEALGRNSHQLFQTEFPRPRQEIEKAFLEQGDWQGELIHTRKDGTRIVVSSRWVLKRGPDGAPAAILEISRDITEHKRLEEHLRDAARMESLGLLAGGIAHDFNNLLVAVVGNASLVLESLDAAYPQRRLLEELLSSADRMADLTRQLLAYAGKGRFVIRSVNLSQVIQEETALLEAAVPKNVRIEFTLPPVPWIEADLAQIQQVVANLVINAAEAIGKDRGTVFVTTGVAEVDESFRAERLGDFAVSSGRFVMLKVQDTGSGMDAATRARIFDPFFTTKFMGRGLGLSAVAGIVRSHQGALDVRSVPGRGSTFELYFPVSSEVAVSVQTAG